MNNIIHLVNPDKNEKLYSPDSIAYQAVVLGLDVTKTLDKYCITECKSFKSMFGFHYGKACAVYTTQIIESKCDNDDFIIAATKRFANTIKRLSDIEFTCAVSTFHATITAMSKPVNSKLYLTLLIVNALHECLCYEPIKKKQVSNLFEVYSYGQF